MYLVYLARDVLLRDLIIIIINTIFLLFFTFFLNFCFVSLRSRLLAWPLSATRAWRSWSGRISNTSGPTSFHVFERESVLHVASGFSLSLVRSPPQRHPRGVGVRSFELSLLYILLKILSRSATGLRLFEQVSHILQMCHCVLSSFSLCFLLCCIVYSHLRVRIHLPGLVRYRSLRSWVFFVWVCTGVRVGCQVWVC